MNVFMVAHNAKCQTVKCLLEVYEDVVKLLLMLEVLLAEDVKIEDLFCSTSTFVEAGLFFRNDVLGLWSQSVQDAFQHYLACMADKTDGAMVLAELEITFLDHNDQSPWLANLLSSRLCCR